ncbi:MAG: hypothetical protein LBU77_07080 [Clostridiales bacterium]|jgi:hypothetical protein|nr:hypothetical protein [Clostridiales bacterium]
MKKWISFCLVVVVVCFVTIAAVFGPAEVSVLRDAELLNHIEIEEKDEDLGGYQYNLRIDQKLYILSNALNNRILPQSDYFASVKPKENLVNIKTQSYALLPNYQEAENNAAAQEKALETLKNELDDLFARGILPVFDFEADMQTYSIGLYTAIDVLEPQRSVPVWQIDLNSNTQLSTFGDGLMSCYMDAETGKIYSIAVRTDNVWTDYAPDEIVDLWCDYLGLNTPAADVADNGLPENTPFYKKYTIAGIEEENTVVTLGFYEGINEFFIKISK